MAMLQLRDANQACLQLFSLDCPTSQGAFCDEQLYNFVTKYVEEELSSAEREQRRPQVQQFSESKWEWEHDREEGSDYAVEESVPRASIIPAVAAHTVIAPDECKHLKFFQMAQLPDKFLQRVLCARTTTTLDTLLKGLTCRAVLWKLGEGFVFNGRDGAASLHGSSGSYRQIDYSEFPVMSDSRDQAILDALDRTVASKTPASRKDAGPVDSWIETVEETTQVPPDEAADLPKATKKMLAEDEMRSSGRPRVPLGYLPGMAEPDLSSDDDEKPSAPAIRPNFEATMLLGNPGTATYPCEFSDSDESSDSDHTTKAVAGTTHKLSSASSMPQPENSKPPKRTEEWSKVSISLQTPPRRDALLSQTQATPTVISSTTPHSATSQSANHDPLDFVEYDKKYARVDNFGLTGNAGLTASHAQENHIATPVRPKRHAIRPRERKPNGLAKTDFEGTQPSARSVTGSGLGPVASTPASATRGNTQALAPAQWEQNITSRNLATGDLVDVASTPLSRPMRMPPGFSNPSQSNVQRSIPSVQDIGSDSLVDVAVVDVMEQSPSRPSASNRLPTDQLLHPAPTDRMHAANEDVAEDTLADFAPSFSRKRNTMNQRAGKNAKSRGKKQTKSSGKKIIAELPMPDPLPPPRARNVNIPGPSTPKAGTAVPIDEQPPLNKFQQALLDTIEKQYVSDDEDDGSLPARNSHRLVLDICQLLLLPEEPDLEKQRASTAEVIQDLLASSEIVTKCFPRLSSSAPDGNILVDLIGSSTTPRLVYEVLITDTAGQKLLCAIPSDDKANFTVKSRHEPTGKSLSIKILGFNADYERFSIRVLAPPSTRMGC